MDAAESAGRGCMVVCRHVVFFGGGRPGVGAVVVMGRTAERGAW
jgi:hypothetical protein